MNAKADILIIDDEQVILDAVTKIASTEGLKIDAALNANDALKMISANKYSLILCDIMMPEMDGFQLLDELLNRGIDIPVIMITGYSTVENAVKSLYKGAIDYIPKPFTFDELMSSIRRGLNFGRIQKKLKQVNQKKGDDSIVYVPCPAQYKRLGYISWVNFEYEGIAIVGATDLFLRTIQSIKKIELMEIDDLIIQGSGCAKFETTDALVHNFLAPVSGRIVEKNEKPLLDKTLLEKDPYFEGWLYKVIPSDIEYDSKYLIPCSSDRI